MKKIVLLMASLITAAALVSGCASSAGVTRIDAETTVDLSGFWNDTDVRIVCDSLIKDCMSSPRVSKFEAQKGRLPVVKVGSFRNQSDEHIDTSIITKKMETAILNSGVADFVASKAETSEIRDERNDQQGNASEDSAKALGNETGADFLLTGSVKTIVDKAGGKATRTYFVFAELTDIETNKRLWQGENSEIKKMIKRDSVRF